VTSTFSGFGFINGDANLDDIVNSDDFNILATNFGLTVNGWSFGNFSLNGIVDSDDFNILASNFGLGAGPDGVRPEDWADLASAVPEPAATLWLAFVAAGVRLRRQRG
jgi:hypothetical protein